MALFSTRPWKEVAEILFGAGTPSDRQAQCRRDFWRSLMAQLRAAEFPYTVYPTADPEDLAKLELYPDDHYDFDLGFGRGMWFDVRTEEYELWSSAGRVREPVASVTVTYISYNRRLDTYEKRVWEMSQEFLLERLADLFEEVGWPRNDGEGWFSSQLPEKFKNLRENHGKEKD